MGLTDEEEDGVGADIVVADEGLEESSKLFVSHLMSIN